MLQPQLFVWQAAAAGTEVFGSLMASRTNSMGPGEKDQISTQFTSNLIHQRWVSSCEFWRMSIFQQAARSGQIGEQPIFDNQQVSMFRKLHVLFPAPSSRQPEPSREQTRWMAFTTCPTRQDWHRKDSQRTRERSRRRWCISKCMRCGSVEVTVRLPKCEDAGCVCCSFQDIIGVRHS